MHGSDGEGAWVHRGEPRHTIFRPWWNEAWKRVGHSDEELRPLFAALLNAVEKGWLTVRTLQLAYERDAETPGAAKDDRQYLLDFIDGDVVDLYRSVAIGCTRLIPGPDGPDPAADPFAVWGDAELFARYLRLLALAARSAAVPPELRERIEHVERMLRGWLPEVTALLAEVEERVMRAEEAREEEDG
jgi:hypothetical protein